jgi:hypothetical protein
VLDMRYVLDRRVIFLAGESWRVASVGAILSVCIGLAGFQADDAEETNLVDISHILIRVEESKIRFR